ncbi:hypothetical protein DCC35_13775 [Mangrovivirga cuniculi]|uniref:Uncharacterized protein n=2 Tax=Mangrovivirga cuniculi TaxID=2715131 RepID=A0A4D7JYG1_9BACT|nr:hypothetical protein DCC35_13775 [Mangrovivirga cuniculi]
MFGCSNYEDKIIDDMNSNIENYDSIINIINNNDFKRFKYGQYISREYFPKSLIQALNKTALKGRVQYLILNKGFNCNSKAIEFISSKFHIRYTPCPGPDFPKPGSYEEVGLIETWGIDENWMIWKDNDYI